MPEIPEDIRADGGVPLQRANEGQIKVFLARQKLRGRDRCFNLRQPGRAALFDGLNGHLLPFLALVFRAPVVEVHHDVFGQQRDNPSRAQFDGFLDDGLDDFSPGHGLKQCEGAGRGRREIFQRDGQRDGIAGTVFN